MSVREWNSFNAAKESRSNMASASCGKVWLFALSCGRGQIPRPLSNSIDQDTVNPVYGLAPSVR